MTYRFVNETVHLLDIPERAVPREWPRTLCCKLLLSSILETAVTVPTEVTAFTFDSAVASCTGLTARRRAEIEAEQELARVFTGTDLNYASAIVREALEKADQS